MILPAEFYEGDSVELARNLIGMRLVHETRTGLVSGRITETEAYLRDDPACHASRGMTKRNAAMFGPPGHAYIYLIYGTYYCFNVVSGPEGIGEAVLIRALEPLEGIEKMQRRRGTKDVHNLCSGPGKLVIALGIPRDINFHPLTRRPLYITDLPGKPAPEDIVATPRIGLSVACDVKLRFYLKGSRFASRRCLLTTKPARHKSN